MAKAWISDLWVKDATVTLPDGSTTKISPSREQMRSLKSLPEHFRTTRWMKGKRWRVTWHEDSANGPLAHSKSFDSKGDAEEYASELEDDIRMGRYIDPRERERPFGEVAEAWLDSKKKVKESTWLRYRQELDNYVLPRWANVPIGAIKRNDIDDWVTQLAAGEAVSSFKVRKTQTKLAPSSLAHIARIGFGGPVRYAIEARLIAVNPMRGVELPRVEGDEIDDLHTLTLPEVEELATEALRIAQADGRSATKTQDRHGDGSLVRFLAYCGPRVNEALALKVKDIDIDARRAHIRRTWTKSKTGARKLGTPKTWERRAVPIPAFLVPELRALLAGRGPEDYVFRATRGGAIDHKNWYNRVWRRALGAVGIPDDFGLTIHDLRHTAASLAIASGADVKLVQNMLGHRDATETLNTYSHLWPDRLDEVMDALTAHRNRALGIELAKAA